MSTLIAFESCLKKKKRSLKEGLSHLAHQRKNEFNVSDNSFAWTVYPHACSIFNLLNPLYLANVKDFESFASHNYILVRDGFYPLADFFYRFSRPGQCNVILLIHEKLKFIVPEAWENNVLTYNIQKNFDYKKNQSSPRSLYLCAWSCDSDVRHKTFSKKLSQVKQFYSESLNNIDLKFALFNRGDPYYRYRKERLHESYFLLEEIYKQFGRDHQLVTWDEIIKERGLHQSCYYYMAEEYFSHAYSYLDHFFLSNRCTPFDNRFDRQEVGQVVFNTLSHYDIHINDFHFQQNDLWPEIIKLANDLGIGSTLFYSEFFHYAWEIANEHLFAQKKSISVPSLKKAPIKKDFPIVSQEEIQLH